MTVIAMSDKEFLRLKVLQDVAEMRRSQRDCTTWARANQIANAFTPKTRIHPWSHQRFAVKHPRWEPSARIGLARICAGGAG